jgi:hypothetical protein
MCLIAKNTTCVCVGGWSSYILGCLGCGSWNKLHLQFTLLIIIGVSFNISFGLEKLGWPTDYGTLLHFKLCPQQVTSNTWSSSLSNPSFSMHNFTNMFTYKFAYSNVIPTAKWRPQPWFMSWTLQNVDMDLNVLDCNEYCVCVGGGVWGPHHNPFPVHIADY